MSDFDRFMEEHSDEYASTPEAFAAWLAGETGEPVTGVALDLSSTVYVAPKPERKP